MYIFPSSENSGGEEVRGATQVSANPDGALLQGAAGGEPQQESETCPDERINRTEHFKYIKHTFSRLLVYRECIKPFNHISIHFI